MEVVKKIDKEYGWLTNEIQIMEALIKVEDANSLQHFTNFSNKHSGYVNTLLNLSIAFLRNNRLSQCKQVLQVSFSVFFSKLIASNCKLLNI